MMQTSMTEVANAGVPPQAQKKKPSRGKKAKKDKCSHCGKKQVRPSRGKNVGDIVCLTKCVCCDAVAYCSSECRLADAKRHAKECPGLLCYRKHDPCVEALGNVMEAEWELALLENVFPSGTMNPSEETLLDEARELVDKLVKNGSYDPYCFFTTPLAIQLLRRLLSHDRRLLRALWLDNDNEQAGIRLLCEHVMNMLLTVDMAILGNTLPPTQLRNTIHMAAGSDWLLPACRTILDFLEAFPEEEPAIPLVPSSSSHLVLEKDFDKIRFGPGRCVFYFRFNWYHHIQLLTSLTMRILSDNGAPTTWVSLCLSLWHQLVACLSSPDPAAAVLWGADRALLHHEGPDHQEGFTYYFAPLIEMLHYFQKVEGKESMWARLARQVVALLVAQSHRLEKCILASPSPLGSSGAPPFDVHAQLLEQLFLDAFGSGGQLERWNGEYLPWACALVKERAPSIVHATN
jgi:hypothetical protein